MSYEGMFDETYDGYCECCGRVRPLYYDSTCAPCHEARVFDEPHEHPR